MSALLGPVSAEGAPPRRPTAQASPPPFSVFALSHSEVSDPVTRVRRLASDVRPETSRQLIGLVDDNAFTAQARGRLELVRALHRHANGPLRTEVVRALISLFDTSGTESGQFKDSTREPSPASDSGGLSHWARGSAALALAHSRDEQALRVLLARAGDGADQDPVGHKLARMALKVIPRATLVNEPMASFFSPAYLRSALREDDKEVRLSAETPLSLAQLAKSGAKSAMSDAESSLGWASQIRMLAQGTEVPPALRNTREWRQAYEIEPVWTLRALALLSATALPELTNLTERLAKISLRVESELERSTGAWTLSVVAPQDALDLLQSNEPALIRAVVQQAANEDLALGVHNWATMNPSADEKTIVHAMHMSLLSPATWSLYSNQRLRTLSRDNPHDHRYLSPLAARLGNEAGGLAPRVEEASAWLTDVNWIVRSGAARGLGHATSASAAGLLLQTYRTETNVETRRAIIGALLRHPLAKTEAFQSLIEIDPDAGCRARARGTRDPESLGFFLRYQKTGPVSVVDRLGRELTVWPAPDGFVGVVLSDF